MAGKVTVRVLGFLREHLADKEGGYTFEIEVPPEGRSGKDLAADLGLPPDDIEAMFKNGITTSIDEIVLPGDRIAFLPPGTPGPYRVLLGIKDAGKKDR